MVRRADEATSQGAAGPGQNEAKHARNMTTATFMEGLRPGLIARSGTFTRAAGKGRTPRQAS
jgi:hypothetical protein